jgi:hypothetical protein
MGWAALPCGSWIQAKAPISIPTTRPRPKGLAAAIEPPTTPSSLPFLRPLAAFAATTPSPHSLPQKSQTTQRSASAIQPPTTPPGLPFLRSLAAFAATTPSPHSLPQKSQTTQRSASAIQQPNTPPGIPFLRPLAAFAATTAPFPFGRSNRGERKKGLPPESSRQQALGKAQLALRRLSPPRHPPGYRPHRRRMRRRDEADCQPPQPRWRGRSPSRSRWRS